MRHWRHWMLPAATGIAGLAAGWHLGSGREEVQLAALHPAGQANTPSTADGLTPDDVRRVIREELARRDGSPEIPAPPAPATIPNAKEAAAASQAQSVIEAAISRRAWTEADADAMRDVFPAMNPDQQGEVLRQYSQAVNQGRLIPQTDRVPF